jgi:hypothetical protein
MHAGDAKHTFLFADLAGYTALTEAMGDQDAAGLAGATRTPGRRGGVAQSPAYFPGHSVVVPAIPADQYRWRGARMARG